MTDAARADASARGELGQVLVRYSPTGRPLHVYRQLRAPRCLTTDECNQGVVFGYERRFAAAVETLYYAYNDRYEIHVYSGNGDLLRVVRMQHTPLPITDEDLVGYVNGHFARERRDRALSILRNQARSSPFMPAFKKMTMDRMRNLWIEDVTEVRADRLLFSFDPLTTTWSPTDTRPVWSVLDSTGVLQARVHLPNGLIPMEIGRDYILGVHVDDLGVETVRLHTLSRGQ